MATAYKRKLYRYRHIIREWEDTNKRFQPLVWSHEGRPHPRTESTLLHICKEVARRRGGSGKLIFKRLQDEVGITLAIRRARMAMRCLPPLSARAWHVRYGRRPHDAPEPQEEPDNSQAFTTAEAHDSWWWSADPNEELVQAGTGSAKEPKSEPNRERGATESV